MQEAHKAIVFVPRNNDAGIIDGIGSVVLAFHVSIHKSSMFLVGDYQLSSVIMCQRHALHESHL